MNATLLKALLGLVPASLLLAGSATFFLKRRSTGSVLQLLGAGSLLLVVLAHLCEGLHLFPGMGWGLEHSAAHDLALGSAVLSRVLSPAGYLLHALST